MSKSTKRRRGGPVPTEEQRLEQGWASPRLIRFRQEEEAAIAAKLLQPGEKFGTGVRRVLRGILGLGPTPDNRRSD